MIWSIFLFSVFPVVRQKGKAEGDGQRQKQGPVRRLYSGPGNRAAAWSG